MQDAAPQLDFKKLESLSLKLDDSTKSYNALNTASNLVQLLVLNRNLRQYPRSLSIQDFYVPSQPSDASVSFHLSRTYTIPRLLEVMPRLQSLHLKAIHLPDIAFCSVSVTKLTLTNCHIPERCFSQILAAFPRLQVLTLRGITLLSTPARSDVEEPERIHLPGSNGYDAWLMANQRRAIRRDFAAPAAQGLSLKTLDVELSTIGDFLLWDYLATSGAVVDILHLTVHTTVLSQTLHERVQLMLDKTTTSLYIRGLKCMCA